MFVSITPQDIMASSGPIVNPKQTYNYSKMEKDIKALAKKYPDLITYKVIGKSEYGRNIYAVSLGKGNSTVSINGSHHAREWLTTNLNMYMIEQYARAYKKNTKMGDYHVKTILDNTTIWFVPMVNPDGVELQQKGLSAFPSKDHQALLKMNKGSRDFKRWKANAKGVDLNRQYNAGWKTIRNNAPSPNYENHKGTKPHSSAETKAMVAFTYEIDPEMVVSYHSSGEILFWNYLQTGSRYNRDHAYAKKIGSMTGYRLVYPGPNPSGGGMTDWFVDVFKRPGFTPELGRYAGPTHLPISAFDRVWKQNKYVGLYVAQEGHKLYKQRLPEIAKTEVTKAEKLVKSLTKYRTYSTVNDVTYSSQYKKEYNASQKQIDLANDKVKQLSKGTTKTALQNRLKEVKILQDRSTAAIKAIQGGDKLLVESNRLLTDISKTELTDELIKRRNTLSTNSAKQKDRIALVTGTNNRKIMREKYTIPTNAFIKKLDNPIARFNKLKAIDRLLQSNNLDEAQKELESLSKMARSKDSFLAKVEADLQKREQTLKARYEKLLEESQPQEEPVVEVLEEESLTESIEEDAIVNE